MRRLTRRALESLDGIVEEIIVVHNDCTDRTVQVALTGANVVKKWSGFTDQKTLYLKMYPKMDFIQMPTKLCLKS